MLKIKSYGSAQTNVNGKIINKQNYVLRSDGKKAHVIGQDNGKGYYIKIDNIEQLFHNNTEKKQSTLLKKLNHNLKTTKKRKKKLKKRKK